MSDTELLTDQQIAEIAARKVNDHHLASGAYIGCYIFLSTSERDSLIATVKQLRHDNDLCVKAFELDEALRFSEVGNLNALQIIRKLADLQSQLEQLRAENQQLKLIVDVGTNDDPGTALAKLRKIQHVAATSMRDKCVDAIKSLRATPHGAAYNNAVNDAIRKCESLTLDPLEPEK